MFPPEYQGLTHLLTYDMGYDKNLKWGKWDLGTLGEKQSNLKFFNQKVSMVGNASECKSLLVRIYVIAKRIFEQL